MNLRQLAEQDLATTLEDDVGGFGWPVTLTKPDGTQGSFVARSGDVAQLIDPDTGQAVSGRLASASLRISSLTAAGFELPQGVVDTSARPWVITFDDIGGTSHTFKVEQSDPDRTLGIVTCTLGAYQ